MRDNNQPVGRRHRSKSGLEPLQLRGAILCEDICVESALAFEVIAVIRSQRARRVPTCQTPQPSKYNDQIIFNRQPHPRMLAIRASVCCIVDTHSVEHGSQPAGSLDLYSDTQGDESMTTSDK